MKFGLRRDAFVSAVTPGRRRSSTSKASTRTPTTVSTARFSAPAGKLGQPLEPDVGAVILVRDAARASVVRERHQAAGSDVPEPVRDKAVDKVIRRVMDRSRPDVRLTGERCEQDQRLAEPLIEGRRVGWPADGLDAIPERLWIPRVMQDQGVAEVAHLAPRHRVDPRLMQQQSMHRRGIDIPPSSRLGAQGCHARTIPNGVRLVAIYAGRSRTRTVAPDGRSITVGSASPASAKDARNPSRVTRAVPWYSSSSWTPVISSP